MQESLQDREIYNLLFIGTMTSFVFNSRGNKNRSWWCKCTCKSLIDWFPITAHTPSGLFFLAVGWNIAQYSALRRSDQHQFIYTVCLWQLMQCNSAIRFKFFQVHFPCPTRSLPVHWHSCGSSRQPQQSGYSVRQHQRCWYRSVSRPGVWTELPECVIQSQAICV